MLFSSYHKHELQTNSIEYSRNMKQFVQAISYVLFDMRARAHTHTPSNTKWLLNK